MRRGPQFLRVAALVPYLIGEGKKGQVSPAKFLLEMAGIFPVSEGEIKEATKEEESLAETLLDRLGIPKTSVVADEYQKDETVGCSEVGPAAE